MRILTPENQLLLQRELQGDESVLWSGKPNSRVIFHFSDLYMIPISLAWGGFALFWEHGVTNGFRFGQNPMENFMSLWGIPFILIGQYFIWGRFFYTAWRKNRVLYAVTTRRVIVISTFPKRKSISAFIESLPTLEKDLRADGIGTLKFGQTLNPLKAMQTSNNNWDSLYLNAGIPVFVDIDDAEFVVSLIVNQRDEKLRRLGHSEPPPKPRFL